MQTFNDVLKRFRVFLEGSSYLEVVPCRWGYVRLFNEGEPINFSAVLCQKPCRRFFTLRETVSFQ